MTYELKSESRAGIVMLSLILICLLSSIPAVAGSNLNSTPKDEQRIAGKWLRPDGGYVLELRDVKEDGTLRVSYFNPRPIHVAKAEWRTMGDHHPGLCRTL